ncbi:MAG: class I SAM-dependent methyltransferase [Elusimicrobia bacterium]|nr:class I SAM-dependent methyltransferase [Elusimicrobiota bacterium]
MAKATRWLKGFFRSEIFHPGEPEALAQAPREAAFVARALRLSRGQRVLDLCCGTGRHSFELARRGVSVTGVDATPAYLAEARARLKGRNNPAFVLGDMRKLPFGEEFDAVINLWTSFGYFEDPADDLRALKGAFRALKPGGLFLIDLVDADWNRRHAQAKSWFRRSDGTLVLEELKLREGRDPGLSNTWTVLAPDRAPERASFFVRGYDRPRLCSLLRRAGFRVGKVWGGLDGAAHRAGSRRLVVLARRPG